MAETEVEQVEVSAVYEQVVRGWLGGATKRIQKVIGGTNWELPEKEAVIHALGLDIQTDFHSIAASIYRTAFIILNLASVSELYLEKSQDGGVVYNIALGLDPIVKEFLTQSIYNLLKGAVYAAGSLLKSPAKYEDPLLFNVVATISCVSIFALGAKSFLEKFSIDRLKTRSRLAREERIENGTEPVPLVGHIVAFGGSDSSLAHPLGGILRAFAKLVPVHRGSERPSDVKTDFWISAGPDKGPGTTRSLSERVLLLTANCIDAAAIVVNCMREISVYRTVDMTDTANAPYGVIPPTVADAVIEKTAELTSLVYEDEQARKLYMAIISRYTYEGLDLQGGRVQGRAYFEEPGDVPTVIIEPEELVEKSIGSIIASLKKRKEIEGNPVAYVHITGESSSDLESRGNLINGIRQSNAVDEVTDNIQDANVVIVTGSDDGQTTALIQVYRTQLDNMGKRDIPILVIQKRPDRSGFPGMNKVYTIPVQALIACEVQRILGERLSIGGDYGRLQRRAKRLIRSRVRHSTR